MLKNKRFIGGILIIILLIILEVLGMRTQAKEDTREELKEVVNDSYVENTLDIEKLKDNIEKNIDNSKIVNKDTKEFPVHTVVNEYEFKIEENGKVEDKIEQDSNVSNNNLQENNLQNNNTNDNQQVNNSINNDNEINENPNIEENEEPVIKYQDDEKTDKGITISTTKEGMVNITGKSVDKLFIKISNNIQISNEAKSFEKWKLEDGIIIKKGQKIKQKVTILNNTVNKGQVNVVLRTEDNEAFGILKLVENQTEYDAILNNNIIANYIYIDKGVEIDNIKFKIETIDETNGVIQPIIY